ncbi:MAG: condensin complex protein MksE [Prevotella sp.]|jgi:hypothetical protein
MKYTNEVFQRLSRGQFISSNSIDPMVVSLYNDIEDCQEEYEEYFKKIDFVLSAGDGYYYFSRREPKINLENKLQAMFSWIDYVDVLKTFDTSFSAGTQFTLAKIEIRAGSDPELKRKLMELFSEKKTLREKIAQLAHELEQQGYAELVNEEDGIYQVTNAFHYIEQIIACIQIDEEIENEIPE